ncbi:glycoside hydrolase family 18 protein [Cadophora sp. DSE1049]|nr:glycoside hydrolase family 18 protein [Cadophora sp. DSE1049]
MIGVDASAQIFASASRCPYQKGPAIPGSWTTYHDLDRVSWCNSPMLLDFAVYNPLNDPDTHVTIRATTGSGDNSSTESDLASPSTSFPGHVTQVTFHLSTWADDVKIEDSPSVRDVLATTKLVQGFFRDELNVDVPSIFAYSGGESGVSVGVYIGSGVHKPQFATTTLQKFIRHIETRGTQGQTVLQYCGHNADHVVGVVVDSSDKSLPAVQHVIKNWSDGICLEKGRVETEWAGETLRLRGDEDLGYGVNRTANILGHAFHADFEASDGSEAAQAPLQDEPPACRTVKVVAGEFCDALAAKCKVSPADFTKFNPGPTFCSTLVAGQAVCCSGGSLPDLKPKPAADGSCATYQVRSGDFCDKIAASNALTTSLIESFNKNTWGWMGCSNVQVGQLVCLSSGTPLLPAAFTGAICGPQVLGTVKMTGELASLNPCLLNACCNIWGQCGTVDEFCIPSRSVTGAPGTSAPVSSGCISNCGSSIVNNAVPPALFRRITYYEAWSMDRPCLNMEVSEIDTSKYTHVHFSFGLISSNYKVDVSGVQDQFNKLVKMQGIKRILSFGGWSFSTSQDSYPIFRESVSNQIRMEFANNAAAFVQEHNLDGVDFDWEYPGAPDIPGLPPGSPNDGANYLSFLKLVRGFLPREKTVSVAAPASYWYLKGFPIKEIAEVIDYIIYMTYDLHGQWDYGSPWASPGCPSGACLRSHVNLTETINALSMITKAGVPAAKVVVGTSSYGRSFKMAQTGCTRPDCRFTGPDSAAAQGECTQTSGYIADGEIAQIIAAKPNSHVYHDSASDSSILVYDETEWVAYMDSKTKASRTLMYETLKFGGTSDWAVDLGEYNTDPSIEVADCMPWIGLLIDDLVRFRDSIPDYCVDQIIISGQSRSLEASLDLYQNMLTHDYDAKFKVYARYIRQLLPVQIGHFMAEHDNEHFTCTTTIQVTCCRLSGDSGSHQLQPTYNFTVRNRDAFLIALSKETGIPESWVVFGDKVVDYDPSCWQAGLKCEGKIIWHGFPILSADVVVPNPKKSIRLLATSMGPFSKLLANTAVQARSYLLTEDASEVIAAAMLSVIMMKQAVDSMALVIRTSDAVTQDEARYIISSFVTVVLLLIPFVGEALIGGEAVALSELSMTAQFGVRLGQFGQMADVINTLSDILTDRDNWLQSIASYVSHVPLVNAPNVFEQAAKVWKERGQSNVAGLGLKMGEEVAKINRMREFCPFKM